MNDSSFTFRIGHNCPDSGTEAEFKSKRRSQISTSSSSVPADGSTHGSTPTPPPLPERTDSLNNRSEEAELRKAPWFQAGIPRLVSATLLRVGVKYKHAHTSSHSRGVFSVSRNSTSPLANFKYLSGDPVYSPVSSSYFCKWNTQI